MWLIRKKMCKMNLHYSFAVDIRILKFIVYLIFIIEKLEINWKKTTLIIIVRLRLPKHIKMKNTKILFFTYEIL